MFKKLILVSCLISTSVFAEGFQTHDSWTGNDKTQHAIAGLVIGAAVTAYTKNDNYGMIAGCGVGALKEVSDLHRRNHSATFQDFAVTCLGAVAGAQLVKGLYLTPNGLFYTRSF